MIKNDPSVSIITVVYNEKTTIYETLKSVFDQDYRHIEYLVIDGNSTDGTTDILKGNRQSIDVLVIEDDDGIYDAMNKGIEKASGDIVFFLNAGDTLYDSNVISDIVRIYKENAPVDLVHGTIRMQYLNPDYVVDGGCELSRKKLSNGIQPPHPGTFVRRDKIVELGLFDTRYKSAADFDFFCKAVVHQLRIFKTDRIISTFRAGGISSDKSISWTEGAKIIHHYFGSYPYIAYSLKTSLFLVLKKLLILLRLYGLFSRICRRHYS